MKSNSQLFLTAVLLIAFLALWDKLVVSRYAPPHPSKAAATATVAGNAPSSLPPTTAAQFTTAHGAVVPVTRTLLETDHEQVTVDSWGARVTSWRIKEKDHWIEFVPAKATTFPLEMFPDLNYSVRRMSAKTAEFTATHPAGFIVSKTIALEAHAPFHSVIIGLSNATNAPLKAEVTLGWAGGLDKKQVNEPLDEKLDQATLVEMRVSGFSQLIKSWQPGFFRNRVIDRVESGPFDWIGVDNNHFVAAFLPGLAPLTNIHITAQRGKPPVMAIPLSAELKPREVKLYSFDMYVGPKKYNELKALGHHLDASMNFGFFGPISKFLLRSLEHLKKITGNYGWAIIILTMMIQIVVFPLTRKSLHHTARMKEVQPQLKKLQEQFKKDPKRLQIETFNLYKKHGMRFMGMEGCFPMMLQIPIFIALFNTLRSSYELRGAPWILWIKDLSHYDPFYVLPILMGAGMFAQQKVTTVPSDPAQAKVMMFMPVMMTVMFHKLPAGLVLYWVVNSLMTILIQWILLSRMKARAPQPA